MILMTVSDQEDEIVGFVLDNFPDARLGMCLCCPIIELQREADATLLRLIYGDSVYPVRWCGEV